MKEKGGSVCSDENIDYLNKLVKNISENKNSNILKRIKIYYENYEKTIEM